MRTFTYKVPSSIQQATSDFGQNSDFVAGGTTLIDLMKLEVLTPSQLVDINRLPMRGIELARPRGFEGYVNRKSFKIKPSA